MNFLQHKREIQLTQSTRCDFISAVLSNKFLYKVWSPTPFERTLVYGSTDSLQFLMKKIAKVRESTEMLVWLWIPWDSQRDVAPNCETNDWIFAENLLTLPWASKDEGPFFKRRSVVLGSRCFCLCGVPTDQIQTLKWHQWGRIDQIWCGNHLPVDWQTFTVSSLW